MTEQIQKAPTGVSGLDGLTGGGLPRDMLTVIVGGPGTGKTMVGSAFVVRGAEDFTEPGVIVSLEQGSAGLVRTLNTAGMDLNALVEQGLLEIVGVRPESLHAGVSGHYSLDGLLTRIQAAAQKVGARRLLIDTADALLLGSPDDLDARLAFEDLVAQVRQLGLATVITAQDPEDSLIGGRLVEYLADCVISLSLEQHDRHASRSLRVVKYRGSAHVGDAVALHIDEHGPATVPMAFVRLADVEVDSSTISTGLADLDGMLGGDGYFRRSTVMVTGTAGTGKTSLGAYFAVATAEAGEPALFISFEESPTQLLRNMASIGLDLDSCLRSGHLRIEAVRPEERSLEGHLRHIVGLLDEHQPSAVVVDPVTALSSLAPEFDLVGALTRLADLLHSRGATGLFTALDRGEAGEQRALSSLVDTWLHVRNVEEAGERNRTLYVNKSRGMPHTNQVREFVMGPEGVQLRDIVTAGDRVVTGSARTVELRRREAEAARRDRDRDALLASIERSRSVMEAQIEALRAQHEQERLDLEARIQALVSEATLADEAAHAAQEERGGRKTGGAS